MVDPKNLNARDLPDTARRAARKQVPAAHQGLVRAAEERLLPWLEGAARPDPRRAPRTSRPDEAWTVAWPPGSRGASIFQGRIDLLYQEPEGSWGIVLLSDVLAPAPIERLRLLLSAHASEKLGYAPLLQAWQIRLGPGGGLSGEDCFDTDVIDKAIRGLGL